MHNKQGFYSLWVINYAVAMITIPTFSKYITADKKRKNKWNLNFGGSFFPQCP